MGWELILNNINTVNTFHEMTVTALRVTNRVIGIILSMQIQHGGPMGNEWWFNQINIYDPGVGCTVGGS